MNTWISEFSNHLKDNAQISTDLQVKFLVTILLLIAITLSRRIVLWMIFRKMSDVSKKYKYNRSGTYIAVSIFIVIIIPLWLKNVVHLFTFIGIVSAGLVIALQDVLKNIAGWIFILIRHPFSVGDRIETGVHQGDVVDIRLFQFTILEVGNWVDADQSTGRLIHIPNGIIFKDALINWFKAFAYIWNEVTVTVTFESDWELAKSIIQKIGDSQAGNREERAAIRIQEAAHRYMIHYKKLSPMVYIVIVENGVKLTLRFLSEARRMRVCQHDAWMAILSEFAKHDNINFAYPTTRFYQNPGIKNEANH